MPLDAIFGHFQLMDQGGFISHASDSQEITVFLFVHDLVFLTHLAFSFLSMKHSYWFPNQFMPRFFTESTGCSAVSWLCAGSDEDGMQGRPPKRLLRGEATRCLQPQQLLGWRFFASENQIDFWKSYPSEREGEGVCFVGNLSRWWVQVCNIFFKIFIANFLGITHHLDKYPIWGVFGYDLRCLWEMIHPFDKHVFHMDGEKPTNGCYFVFDPSR